MSNWDRSQGNSNPYQQNYYNSPNFSNNLPYYGYGNYYEASTPIPSPYEPMVNGSQDVRRNGYQNNYPNQSASAEEFFRMFQEQQQSRQRPQSLHLQSQPLSLPSQQPNDFPDHTEQNNDYTCDDYNIPTMVFPSSSTSARGESSEVPQVKRKPFEQPRTGGSGRFGNRSYGAVPKQNSFGNGFNKKGNYNNRKNAQTYPQNQNQNQQQNRRNQQNWASIPNNEMAGEDVVNGTTENNKSNGTGARRGKASYNQRNYSKSNNYYQRDSFGNGGVTSTSRNSGGGYPREDWRAKSGGGKAGGSGGHREGGVGKKEESQRERLTSQLYSGQLECLVCCERMRQADHVWSCPSCHHVLHLRCVVKWASSSRGDNGWRCPACQNVTKSIPTEYKCMCGKVTNPQWVRGETPHTCGQVCGKDRGCPHLCTLLCHPGPCPPCSANIDRYCGCGRTKQVVQCSSKVSITCEASCDKPLNCKKHFCTEGCHNSPCKLCDKTVHQSCHCKGEERDVPCDENSREVEYCCEKMCKKKLGCGLHECNETCHPGPCPVCPLSPSVVLTCPCGKKTLDKNERKSCTDPIPTCAATCGKVLPCGNPGKRHTCASKCHTGDCPPCPGTSSVRCRCGAMAKEVDCATLDSRPDDARCSKRCTKKRSCGRHKCNQNCCIEIDHVCPQICNKLLSCGNHRCTELCHRGNCRACLSASFTELSCECGKSILFPPIPCGTRPPECKEPCSRDHPCGHPPTHHCHSQSECPPCSVLTTRYCFGAHELRKTVPCHLGDYSCGRPCNKPLECGHLCIKICHTGPCLPEGTHCVQPCTTSRASCGHPCSSPCHPGSPCSPPPCQAKVEVKCECGRRVVMRSCSENSSEYQRLATAQLASQMAEVSLGKTIDLRTMNKPILKLDCTDECRKAERNLRLAIGLQISNPDLSSKLQPRYSQFLLTWAKKDPKFAQNVHEKLTEVVQLAKTSKQKSRSYSFPSMKSEKRQFIHEYSEHFGVESVAYDAEPNRNVVATAYKDKSWLPSYSVLEMLERAAGKRKVPSLLPSLKKDSKEESIMVPVRLKPKAAESKQDAEPDEPAIDYFDYVNPSQP